MLRLQDIGNSEDAGREAAPGVRAIHGTLGAGDRIGIPAGRALWILPIEGGLTLGAPGPARVGEGFLHHGGAMLGVDAGHARCIVLAFPATLLNAVASARLGDGRRLVRCACRLPVSADIRALATRAADAACPVEPAVVHRLMAALVDAIVAEGAAATLLPPLRAVSQAMAILRERLGEPVVVERLATMVGVTPQTLRKGFRLCLGATIKEYALATRLDWARARLESGRESRSVAELARVIGFTDGTYFSRSYVRRFGETPSHTRARAVRMAA